MADRDVPRDDGNEEWLAKLGVVRSGGVFKWLPLGAAGGAGTDVRRMPLCFVPLSPTAASDYKWTGETASDASQLSVL